MKKKLIQICFLLSTTIVFNGCASLGGKVPSEAEINAEAENAYKEIKTKSKLSTNANWNAMVQRVAQRIAAASGVNYKWEAILIENNEPNAWCMPGGKMAVYTGIMPIVKTEAALAAVMGHEVAHATLKHGQQNYARAAQEQSKTLLIGVAAAAGGQFLCKTEQCKQLVALSGTAATFYLAFQNRKFSRTDESSADSQGLVYMAKAGYDPNESVKLWERMNAAGGAKGPEWMSTHPSGENRIKALQQQMSSAMQIYQSAPQKYGLGQNVN